MKLSYANVVSTLALVVALGGGAYAAVELPKNSVGTKQIKKKAVTLARRDCGVTSQPGWHPDPVPPQPGQPPLLRYWDGARWTEHTAPAQAPAATQQYAAPAYPAAYGSYGTELRRSEAARDHARRRPACRLVAAGPRADHRRPHPGDRSAGIVAFPWPRDVFDIYSDWFDEQRANGPTAAPVDTSQLQTRHRQAVRDHRRDQPRPGLRVQRRVPDVEAGHPRQAGPRAAGPAPGRTRPDAARDRPAPLAGSVGVGIIGLIPIIGGLSVIYSLLDYLWPLWDDKKQAIHDKIAKTNVVRIR